MSGTRTRNARTPHRWQRALEALIWRVACRLYVDPDELVHGKAPRHYLDAEGRPLDLSSRLKDGNVPSLTPRLTDQHQRELAVAIQRGARIEQEEAERAERERELEKRLAGVRGERPTFLLVGAGLMLGIALLLIEVAQNIPAFADLSGLDIEGSVLLSPWAFIGTVGLGVSALAGLGLGAFLGLRLGRWGLAVAFLASTSLAVALARLPHDLDLTEPRAWSVIVLGTVGALALALAALALERALHLPACRYLRWRERHLQVLGELEAVRRRRQALAKRREATERLVRKLSAGIDAATKEYWSYRLGHVWSVYEAAKTIAEWKAKHGDHEPEDPGEEES